MLLTASLAVATVAGCGDGGSRAAPSTITSTQTTSTTSNTGGNGGTPMATGNGDGGVKLTQLGHFNQPVYVTQPDSGSDDLFIVEQDGRIQELAPSGDVSTFLDISDETTASGEQGLLSMAFAPDYARSGLFYVDYTDNDGNTQVVEYTAKDGVVDASSARNVLEVDQPYPNHNGGLVLFGPDGDLYIGLGDGGDGGDPDRNGLDLSTRLGKILRIDPAQDGKNPFSVPGDNPFVGRQDALPEIYSYGLRNPWRFSFDSETGDLTIGDVGQEEQEEVDIVARGGGSGASFGWSALEGDQVYNDDQESPDAITPALVATHADGNCSITGGLVVRDRDLPTLYGRYLYGDFCLGELHSFTPEPGKRAGDDMPLGLDVASVSSFGTDAGSNVYAVSIEGSLFRLDPAG